MPVTGVWAQSLTESPPPVGGGTFSKHVSDRNGAECQETGFPAGHFRSAGETAT